MTLAIDPHVRPGESRYTVVDGTTYRRRLHWMAVRCYDRGTDAGWIKHRQPLTACPHGCLDLPPYLCMTCQGSGYVVAYAPTCAARLWRSCSRPDGTPLRSWWRANGRVDTRELCGETCSRTKLGR